MTRHVWNDIARALAHLHATLLEHAATIPARRAAHRERAAGVELAARAICAALRARSSRFDSRRFLRIVRAGAAAK